MGDILIVDDERDIRELVSDILIDEGYTTRLAANSDDCMSQISSEPTTAKWLTIVGDAIEALEDLTNMIFRDPWSPIRHFDRCLVL